MDCMCCACCMLVLQYPNDVSEDTEHVRCACAPLLSACSYKVMLGGHTLCAAKVVEWGDRKHSQLQFVQEGEWAAGVLGRQQQGKLRWVVGMTWGEADAIPCCSHHAAKSSAPKHCPVSGRVRDRWASRAAVLGPILRRSELPGRGRKGCPMGGHPCNASCPFLLSCRRAQWDAAHGGEGS